MDGENATYTRASVNCASGYRLAARAAYPHPRHGRGWTAPGQRQQIS